MEYLAFWKFNSSIVTLIILDALYIITFIYRYFKFKSIKKGTLLFIETLKIHKNLILTLSVSIIFIAIFGNFITSFNNANKYIAYIHAIFYTGFLIHWYLFKRLAITTTGISYINLFKSISRNSLLYWERIEYFELDGLQLKIYLKDRNKCKIYQTDLSSDEKLELKKILNENIKKSSI